MKKLLFCILVFILISCTEKRKKHDLNSLEIDLSKNYSEIFDSAQTYLKTHDGKFPIMVYQNQLNGKQLIYFGEQHCNDPKDNRFNKILWYFKKFNPEILLNEGGDIDQKLHYLNKYTAIKEQGTLGFLKFIADQNKIKVKNADCPDSIETKFLLKKFKKDDVLFSFVLQRFLPQFIQSHDKKKNLKLEYNNFVTNYLNKRCLFGLTKQESSWDYFKSLYLRYTDKMFSIDHFDLSESEKYNEKNIFGEIAQTSMQIRDSVILTNIYNTFKKYDKVMVVFGALHLMAEKPTLDKMFEKKTLINYLRTF